MANLSDIFLPFSLSLIAKMFSVDILHFFIYDIYIYIYLILYPFLHFLLSDVDSIERFLFYIIFSSKHFS